MDKWQPIETAPHNKRILIQSNTASCNEMAMAWWDRSDDKLYYAPQGGLVQWKPTHWMPIPEPPPSYPHRRVQMTKRWHVITAGVIAYLILASLLTWLLYGTMPTAVIALLNLSLCFLTLGSAMVTADRYR